MAACSALKNLRVEEMFLAKGNIWKCRMCGEEGVRTALQTHVLNQHLVPGQVPWRCGGCSSRYLKKKPLKRHQKSKHPEGAKVLRSEEDFVWATFLKKRTAIYSKGYYRRSLISPPPQEAPVLVKVEPVEDDDLGPMPEIALDDGQAEEEVEEEVEPEEQEVADDLEEPEEEVEPEEQEVADDLEEPEVEEEVEPEEQEVDDDLEEPEMEQEVEPEEQEVADDLGPKAALEEPGMKDDLGPMPQITIEEPNVEGSSNVHSIKKLKGEGPADAESEGVGMAAAIKLACRPYQESIRTLKEDGRRRQREVDSLRQAMTCLREELATLRREVQTRSTRPRSPVRRGHTHTPHNRQSSRRPEQRHRSFPDDVSPERGHRRVMFQARRPHYHH